MATGDEPTDTEAAAADQDSSDVVYWAMNGYGVTMFDVLVSSLTYLLAVAVMTLNALVFDTMVRLKPSLEPADVLVCSLAIADFLSGVLLVYNTIYNMVNYQFYIECLLRCGVLVGLLSTSVLHLIILTLDRYVKIIMPYRYEHLFTINSMLVAAAVVWIVSITIALTPAMGWNVDIANVTTDLVTAIEPGVQDDVPKCTFFGTIHSGFLKLVCSLFFLPFVFMGILYLHIFQVAHRHARSIAAQGMGHSGKDFRESHSWKYTKTVLILMGLYFICWLPSGTLIILFVNGDLQQYNVVEQGTYLAYIVGIGFVNSVVNPIVYAFKIRAVRQRFRKIFSCLRCCSCRSREKGAQPMTVFSLESAANHAELQLLEARKNLTETGVNVARNGTSRIRCMGDSFGKPVDVSI